MQRIKTGFSAALFSFSLVLGTGMIAGNLAMACDGESCAHGKKAECDCKKGCKDGKCKHKKGKKAEKHADHADHADHGDHHDEAEAH